MKEIAVDLVKGRHEMPVAEYIFDGDVNPVDFNLIEEKVVAWINTLDAFKTEDVDFMFPMYPMTESIHVKLYVTGLSSALVSVIKWCAKCHINLDLMHYDKETGEYKSQSIF